MTGKRIGWLGDWGGSYIYEDGIAPLCEAGLAVLETKIEPVAVPHPSEAIWDSWNTLRSWSVAAKHQAIWNDPEKRRRLKADAAWEIERGLGFSAMELHDASAAASAWYRRAAELFQRFDALVLPSAQTWPFPTEWEWPKSLGGREMDTYHRWMECVVPVSLIGLPCVNLPVGFGGEGLPMGMQLFGPRGADFALLQMAQAYHEATDWPGAKPPPL